MKLNLLKINVIVLLLVIEGHSGVIDGIYGSIKNTTQGLTQDARNIWNYGKGLVGKETEEEKHAERGLIGGMMHSAHEKMHSFHEKIWHPEDIPSDSGLLWSWYCRLMQRLSNAKHYVLGDKEEPIATSPQPTLEDLLVKETMEKIFFPNGTRRIDGGAFYEAVEGLKKKLSEMRGQTTTVNPTTTDNHVNDGEGLIDVRLANVDKDSKDNTDVAGVANDIHDKVQEK